MKKNMCYEKENRKQKNKTKTRIFQSNDEQT